MRSKRRKKVLAAEAGLSTSTISNIECHRALMCLAVSCGLQRPKQATAQRLAVATGDIKRAPTLSNSLYAGRACSPNPNCSNLQKTNASASSQDSDETANDTSGRQLTPLTPEGRAERPLRGFNCCSFSQTVLHDTPYEVNWQRLV